MSFLIPGIVSVTFRSLTPDAIIRLAVEANVQFIEWGGDIHAPPGDVAAARDVGARTRAAGLDVISYGSYYRVGGSDEGIDFARHLESAAALGAPTIRVWAGSCGSAEADSQTIARIIEDTRRICQLASSAGISVAYEFHGGTLADNGDAALFLLQEAAAPNLKTLWQPLGTQTPQAYCDEIQSLLPWLAHVHVYHWPGGARVPLADGLAVWKSLLPVLAAANRPIGLLLEFVRDDSPEQFLADAAALRVWISGVD